MNPNSADNFIPAEARTSLDIPPLWGRFVSVSPEEAEFLSQFELPAGRMLTLSFELGGIAFEHVRARIKTVLRDGDGYYNYLLIFADQEQKNSIRAALNPARR
jgi:hypothetical protein